MGNNIIKKVLRIDGVMDKVDEVKGMEKIENNEEEVKKEEMEERIIIKKKDMKEEKDGLKELKERLRKIKKGEDIMEVGEERKGYEEIFEWGIYKKKKK